MSGPSEKGGRAEGWHIATGGKTYGPYEWGELLAWVRQGRVGPDTLVWHSQSPAWIPARQVPGLFPVSLPSPPPPPPRAHPRRLGGRQLASICLTVAILLAGAGVGTWLAVRGGDDAKGGATVATGGTAAGTGLTDPQDEIKVETLSLGGTVVLPEGAALSPADLAMLSNTSEASCGAAGDFQVSALHDEGARTVLLAVNGVRNPVLLAIADASTPHMQPSVASTARALVLYEPAFLSLPLAAYAAAADRLESHPRLSELETALADSIRSDPTAPLDGDAHPGLYDLAARIAADVLADVIEIDEQAEQQAAQGPVLLAWRGPASVAAADHKRLFAEAAGPGKFVDVIDDPEHATPEVMLVNTTWAAYNVTWTRTTAEGSTTGKAFLPRCAPWRVDTGSLKLGWPPVGFKLEKLVNVGDGHLAFQFRRNDEYMAFDIAANLTVLLVGVGAESIRKFEGDGTGVAAAANTWAATVQLSKEFGALGARMQGQSLAGCAKELGGFMLVSGGKVLLAVWPLLQNEIKEEFVTVLGKVITRRMAAVAVLGYGAVDLIAQLKAFSDPTIAGYQTGGVQLANVYPLDVSLDVSVTPKQAGTYVFQASVSGLPADFSVPLELVVDYGDGSKKQRIQPNIESGQGVVAFKHTYGGEVPNKAVVTLQTAGNKAAIMASREVDLPVETHGPEELWFTVLFQGGGDFKLTVGGAHGMFNFDFLRFLDPIQVYRSGRAYGEYSNDMGSCSFEGVYDKSKKTLTGTYKSSFTRIDTYSEISESLVGTLEGTLVYRPGEIEGKPNIFTMRGRIVCSGQVVYVDIDGIGADDSYQKPIEIDYSFVANGDTGPE